MLSLRVLTGLKLFLIVINSLQVYLLVDILAMASFYNFIQSFIGVQLILVRGLTCKFRNWTSKLLQTVRNDFIPVGTLWDNFEGQGIKL